MTGSVASPVRLDVGTSRARRPLAALAFGAALVSHWPFRRLDLDFHHDGYMAAVAVAVADLHHGLGNAVGLLGDPSAVATCQNHGLDEAASLLPSGAD